MIDLKTIDKKIIIGCPIHDRAWILPEWFNCITNQAGLNLEQTELVFAITDGEDNTREIIEQYRWIFKDITLLNCDDLPAYKDRNQARFYPLVTLRNRIVEFLREKQPDLYFSFDSDIILPNDALITLIEDDKDLVAPYVDLVPPSGIPNCMHRGAQESFVRRKPYSHYYPLGSLYKVDSAFAVFLMKNKVFNTCLYKWHPGGEDPGFSLELLDAGFESWIDSRIIGTHIYNRF
jgi:hypothetical protein